MMPRTITALAVLAVLCGYAEGHEAPKMPGYSAWSYPLECCSDQDCKPISANEVQELTDGSVLDTITGVTLTGKQVRFGGDGSWHICNLGGDRKGRPLCVFKPQRLF